MVDFILGRVQLISTESQGQNNVFNLLWKWRNEQPNESTLPCVCTNIEEEYDLHFALYP